MGIGRTQVAWGVHVGDTMTVDMPCKTLPAAPLPTSPPLPTSALAVAPLAVILYASGHTHMPTHSHLQAMHPPIFWVSEKRSGGVCTLRTPGSLSRNAPTPARPCLQATLLPFPHVMPGRLCLQAMHLPIPHAMPSCPHLQATRPPVPHAMPGHPRLHATHPAVPYATPTHLHLSLCW